jgi:putative transposase
MPWGLQRYYGAGDLHFITCSCYRRQALLGTAKRRDLFLKVLEQVRRRYQFVVVGYVVMPEHFHLLISEPQERTPSTVMQALKLGFARRVLAEQRRRAHNPAPGDLFEHKLQSIWQARFYDFNVWTARKRVEKLRYMHRNPVKRGLVESPELWRWSSYRAYACGERGVVCVNEWQVLKLKIRKPAAKKLMVPAVHKPQVSKTARPGAPSFRTMQTKIPMWSILCLG